MTKTNICRDCVKEHHLKEYIENLKEIEECSFCNSKTYVCDYESKDFYNLLKSLIRYHYSEWDYNSHWGGEELYKLIENDDILFNKNNFKNANDFDIIIELVDSFEAYEDYEKGISFYAGYDSEGNQNMLLRALKSEYDRELVKITDKLKTRNYFELEDFITNRLKEFVTTAKIIVHKNEKYYRARIGYSKKDYDYLSAEMEGAYLYTPFKGNEISSPPPSKSQSGRLNRTGVSFLYCATTESTAISEVRPHPGDKVSIGCFIAKGELSVFDISKSYLLEYFHSDKHLDEYFVFMNTINNYFQRSIPPSKKDNYSITQLIADSIRKLGFDGILFNSSVGNGKNIVVFNPDKMEYNEEGNSVVDVEKVEYDFTKIN
jgi:hypothetical protein